MHSIKNFTCSTEFIACSTNSDKLVYRWVWWWSVIRWSSDRDRWSDGIALVTIWRILHSKIPRDNFLRRMDPNLVVDERSMWPAQLLLFLLLFLLLLNLPVEPMLLKPVLFHTVPVAPGPTIDNVANCSSFIEMPLQRWIYEITFGFINFRQDR